MGAHHNVAAAAARLREAISEMLADLERMAPAERRRCVASGSASSEPSVKAPPPTRLLGPVPRTSRAPLPPLVGDLTNGGASPPYLSAGPRSHLNASTVSPPGFCGGLTSPGLARVYCLVRESSLGGRTDRRMESHGAEVVDSPVRWRRRPPSSSSSRGPCARLTAA